MRTCIVIRLAILFAVVIGGGTLPLRGQDVLYSLANGSYRSGGLVIPVPTEYIAGIRSGIEYRNFAIFDPTTYSEPITSAVLRYNNPQVDPAFSTVIEVYDVSSPLSVVLQPSGGPGAAVYNDLGTGTLLGSRQISIFVNPIPPEQVTVNLNAAAIAALNSASGPLAFGATINNPVTGGEHYYFGGTTFDPVELILNGAPPAPPRSIDLLTDTHPVPSFLKFEVFLGDPNLEGALLATVQRAVHGELTAGMAVSGEDVSHVWLRGADLTMNNIVGTRLDLGPLGSIRLDALGLNLDFGATVMPVDAGSFLLSDSLLSIVTLGEGVGRLRDPAGALAALLGSDFETEIDFAQAPLRLRSNDLFDPTGIGGTVDFGAGLFATGPEINIIIPEILVPLEVEESLGVEVFMRLSGEFHLAAVPEPSSIILGGIGAFGLATAIRRARRRRGR